MDEKLFSLELNGNPDGSRRLAHGDNTIEENITFDQLYVLLSELYADKDHGHDEYALDTQIPVTTNHAISAIKSDVTVIDYALKKYGNVVTFTMKFTRVSADSGTTTVKLCEIDPAVKPSGASELARCALSPVNGSLNETGSLYVTALGGVYINVGKDNQTWVFGLSWIL